MPSLPKPRPTPCLRCREGHRKCSSQLPSCHRCVRLGHACIYPHLGLQEASPDTTAPKPPPAAPPQPKSRNPLREYVGAISTSLIDFEARDWTLEDPDLMPTTADYFLLLSFLRDNDDGRQIYLAVDVPFFLDNFFLEPPPLRLALCAIAAHVSKPSLPDQTVLSYYNRARKAVFRDAKPSLRSVQALYWIHIFSLWKGQPVISQVFLESAIRMILALGMEVDPDDSPWLINLKLSDRQKEERRFTFWGCFYNYIAQKSLSDDSIAVEISADKMRIGNDIPGVFPSGVTIVPVCSSYSLASAIRKHHSTVPTSLQDIISSPLLTDLNTLLLSIPAQIPLEFLFISESPDTLSQSDYDRFNSLAQSIAPPALAFVFNMNLNLLSSVSLFYRPQLYLSALPSCHPSRIPTDTRTSIINAISQCLDAAKRMATLFGYILAVMEAENAHLPDDKADEKRKGGLMMVYPLLECVIVYWFVMCRMDPVWWEYVGGVWRVDWKGGERKRVMDVVGYVAGVYGWQGSGALNPIVVCMEAMVGEIERRVVGGAGLVNSVGLELAMKVASIGSNVEEAKKEPWAFMGLLGLEVAGGIRWKGRNEEGWRLLWIRNGMPK